MTEAAPEVAHAEPHDSDGTHDKPSSLWIFWLVIALLFAYPLSLGPVAKYYKARRPVPAAIVALYQPLEFLDGKSSTAHRVFKWYLRIWGVR